MFVFVLSDNPGERVVVWLSPDFFNQEWPDKIEHLPEAEDPRPVTAQFRACHHDMPTDDRLLRHFPASDLGCRALRHTDRLLACPEYCHMHRVQVGVLAAAGERHPRDGHIDE